VTAAHLAADTEDAQTALWRAYACESYRAGHDDALAKIAAVWPSWPPLRPADGPATAELRTRETFADPHPGDYPGTDPRR